MLALVLLLGASSFLLGGGSAGRLPDLVQRVPPKVVLHDGRLSFTSQVDNVGAGPLEIVARRSTEMRADQVVYLRGGGRRVYEGVGRLHYVRSPDHQHWHLVGFERFELWRGGRLLVRDHKTGFCLYDRLSVTGMARTPLRYLRDCGRNRPQALEVREGISAAHGDAYEPRLEGQSLDVRGLAPGVYTLVQRVNVGRVLRESRYDNNVSRLRIRLTPTNVTALPG
jgi:Lysyl oxidase